MKVLYTEYQRDTNIVDLEQFWQQWLSNGISQAEKNWQHFKVTDEPYCYGRNLYFEETWNSKSYQSPDKLIETYKPMWGVLFEKFYQPK